MHVSIIPRCHPFEDLELLSKTSEGWKKVVLAYDKIEYNYYDKTDEELEWLGRVRALIHDTCPEEYKTGTHLLFEQASFMGEDICIHHGQICTTMHHPHKKCGQYKVVVWSWDQGGWCLHCQEVVKREEIGKD